MKKVYLSIAAILIFGFMKAQIIIGKNTQEGYGLIDFNSENKGIILPAVNVVSGKSYSNGTILFDQKDRKIKVMENNTWLELSDEGTLEELLDSQNNKISTKRVINTSNEGNGSGLIVGATTTTVEGVLVLESTDHALILPKVADPHLKVLSPTAGTIVYDTTSKSLALFDGKVWNYWR